MHDEISPHGLPSLSIELFVYNFRSVVGKTYFEVVERKTFYCINGTTSCNVWAAQCSVGQYSLTIYLMMINCSLWYHYDISLRIKLTDPILDSS